MPAIGGAFPEAERERRPLFDGMPDLLTPAHLAVIRAQCESTVRRMCASGELPAVRIGHRWYVPRTRFSDWCEGVSGQGLRRGAADGKG